MVETEGLGVGSEAIKGCSVSEEIWKEVMRAGVNGDKWSYSRAIEKLCEITEERLKKLEEFAHLHRFPGGWVQSLREYEKENKDGV